MTAKKACLNQSISQNLYSTPSRYLLRGAPNPGQTEKNSLEKVVEISSKIRWLAHQQRKRVLRTTYHKYNPYS